MQPAGKAANQEPVRAREVGFFWRKTTGPFAMPLIFSSCGMEVLKENNQEEKDRQRGRTPWWDHQVGTAVTNAPPHREQ